MGVLLGASRSRWTRLAPVSWGAVCLIAFLPAIVRGQDTSSTTARTSVSDKTDHFQNEVAQLSPAKLREQIGNLNSPSYRTRQLAIWYLEQNPRLSLPLLREAGKTTDLNIGAEVIGMLSWQAMMPDTEISVEAHEALREIAGGSRSVTAVSQLAINALEGIADRQEILAQQGLQDIGALLGPLKLTINGSMENRNFAQSNILQITDEFRGTSDHYKLFRFLRSYEVAYLESKSLNEQMLREILAMPNLKRIVLKGKAINNELLSVMFEARELEHFELAYVPLDDSAIDLIADLPLVGSVRIFGTDISRDGGKRLTKALDGLEVYFGRGGFLGVSTSPTDLRVDSVVPGSGAALGGIIPHDLITHVNDKPVKTMEQLRAELADFAPGEDVLLVVQRFTAQLPGLETIKLKITLGKQESTTR